MSTGKSQQEKREGIIITTHGVTKRTAIDLTEDTETAVSGPVWYQCGRCVKEVAATKVQEEKAAAKLREEEAATKKREEEREEEESSSSDESDHEIDLDRGNCGACGLTNWAGRCKFCEKRCCILCLPDQADLCQVCAKSYQECGLCPAIVKKEASVIHPKCIQEKPCKCCQDCANKAVETCPYCDRDSDSDEDPPPTINAWDCPQCTDDMDYKGDHCDVCGNDVCFDCISNEDTICHPCKDTHRHCKTCGKIEEKEKMKTPPKCRRKFKCGYFCEHCATSRMRPCSSCTRISNVNN